MRDVFTVRSSALPAATRVAGFRGTEAISRPYEFDIYLLMGAEGLELDLADPIGARATLQIDRDDGRPPFLFHGVLSEFELLHEIDERSVFHARLVPRLWQLTQTLHSRMFTNQTIPDIIAQVLEDSGLSGSDYTFKLSGEHKPEEHVCQYLESNFAFISRWMEREGMYYYFEQGDASEQLVISDDKAFQVELDDKPVRFFSLSAHDVSSQEALHTFTCKHQALPATVRLKDYDYAKPTLNLSGSAAVSADGMGEISVYGNRFFAPGDGQRVAKIRSEELMARQAVYRGAGTARYLRPGYFFTLWDHPRPAFDMKYLVTRVEHHGNQTISTADMRAMTGIESDRVYWVDITAIPATVQFRAESTTPWPRIYSHENAVVDGPADSEYAQIDDMGRYNVKFKFDESDLKGGKATTWVRMLQPHGGNPEGFHFPLRKGTEVLLIFLGGDPDRPVISGVVPNAHKPSPVTRSNHTRNVIQTGGKNRVEMEDLSGGQWMHLSTPASTTHLFMGTIGEGDHNFILETQGTGHIHTHGLLNVNVEGIMTETVVGDVTEQYDANVSQTIDGHKTTLVVSGQTETVLAGFDQTIIAFNKRLIVGPYTQTHLGPHAHTHLGAHAHTHLGAHTHTQLGSLTRTRLGTTTETLVGTVTRTVTGDVSETVSGDVGWKIGGDVDIECSDWDVNTGGDRTFHIAGVSVEFTMGAEATFNLSASSEVTVGLKSEIFAGASSEITVGVSSEITVGPKNEQHFPVHNEDAPLKFGEHAVVDFTYGGLFEEGDMHSLEVAIFQSTAGLHVLE